MKQHPRRKPSTPGQKPRVKKAAASADTRWQTCSICHTLPDHSWALWKGGEQQNNNLPPAMNQLLHVGAPFYNTEMSQSNYCLMQCPACGTYYAWDFEYEYLVNGSEDEINLTRLSQTEGEKQAQRNLKAIKAHNAWFMEQVPRQMEALRQAPRTASRRQPISFSARGRKKAAISRLPCRICCRRTRAWEAKAMRRAPCIRLFLYTAVRAGKICRRCG